MFFGRLKEENERLKGEIEARSSIKASFEDSIPKDQTGRKNYVSQIAAFYGVIFKEQLRTMVGQQLQMLSRVGLTKQEEDIFRSNINCLHLINEWCEERTNEHLGNLQNLREQLEDSSDITSEIRDKYGLLWKLQIKTEMRLK